MRAEEEVPVHAISLGLCENVEVSLSHAVFRFIEQNSTPVYEIFPMRNIMLLTWLQRGAASRKPGIKIIAPALMTCDEVDISFNLATQVAELMTFLVEAQVFQYSVFQSFGRWRL